MKKLLLIPFILSLCLLFSCTRAPYGILSYQENDIEASLSVNEKYEIELSKRGDNVTLTILKPTELSGVRFEIEEELSYLCFQDKKIPINKSSLKGITAIAGMFSLDESTLKTAKQEDNLSLLEFSKDNASYTVALDKNSIPQAVEIKSSDYSYSIIINSIKIIE